MELKAVRLIPGTKITHDTMGELQTFNYSDLVKAGVPDIGIHARANRLVIIDVDIPGESHEFDGRPWWQNFCKENEIPRTYTVKTRSGGYHFYYRLPPHINENSYHPPGSLALGVDVKYNGFVGAPPSAGYQAIYGSPYEITVCPAALMAELERVAKEGTAKTYEGVADTGVVLRRVFSEAQVAELKYKIRWVQEHASLTRDEWRDGIFSLKSGAYDRPDVLEELVTMWTCNRAMQAGDIEEAMSICDKADPFGRVGPGSIFSIIDEVFKREGYVPATLNMTVQDVLDKAGVVPKMNQKTGELRVVATEANASAIMGAMFTEKDLYYDARQGLCVFNKNPVSDEEVINTVIPMFQRPGVGMGLETFKKSQIAIGLDVLLQQRQVDPHRDYLKDLRWDGTPRIEKFFIDYFGVEDTEYYRILGLNLWTALAARGLNPGCKLDSVFVLEGHEGIRKSSFVEFLGGEYTYTPSTNRIFQDIDCLRQMHQAIVVELPELKGLLDSDPETVKAFISKPFDHIRGLFAKKAVKRNRGFVMIGTTNSYNYLLRDMGVRRFWPIRVPDSVRSIDLVAMRVHRDQFFAEAVEMYRNGHKYWYMPVELLEPIVKMRQKSQRLVDYIGELFDGRDGFTTLEVFQMLSKFGVVGRKLTDVVSREIEGALMDMGLGKERRGLKYVWVLAADKKVEAFSELMDLV